MPDAGELPGMGCAVVPLVRSRHSGVFEVLAYRLPAATAVVGALDELAEPAGGLRRVQPVGVHRRAGHVVDLPAGEQRAGDLPVAAALVRGEDERALAG